MGLRLGGEEEGMMEVENEEEEMEEEWDVDVVEW